MYKLRVEACETLGLNCTPLDLVWLHGTHKNQTRSRRVCMRSQLYKIKVEKGIAQQDKSKMTQLIALNIFHAAKLDHPTECTERNIAVWYQPEWTSDKAKLHGSRLDPGNNV